MHKTADYTKSKVFLCTSIAGFNVFFSFFVIPVVDRVVVLRTQNSGSFHSGAYAAECNVDVVTSCYDDVGNADLPTPARVDLRTS